MTLPSQVGNRFGDGDNRCGARYNSAAYTPSMTRIKTASLILIQINNRWRVFPRLAIS
jgi:hypothetical protein